MPAYWSDVFGMFVRMLSETALGIDDPDPLGHRLQVWDPDPTKWRDYATDERDALDKAWEQTTQVREERAFKSGPQQGEAKFLETHIDAVRVLLSDKVSEEALVQVEADWCVTRRYRSLEEIAAVQVGYAQLAHVAVPCVIGQRSRLESPLIPEAVESSGRDSVASLPLAD